MPLIVFVTPCPLDEIPSQRFRFEQYLPILQKHGLQYRIHPFFRHKSWRKIYYPGNAGLKIFLTLGGFMRRILLLFTLPFADYVFVHREAAPFGPPVFEWIAVKIFRKRLIYDFDDAIWKTDKTNESITERLLKWRSKIGSICSWSYRVSAGNAYLADFARNFTTNVTINPTTIETDVEYTPAPRVNQAITIGWTGSRSTLKYLLQLTPVLQKIRDEFPQVEILVIADGSDYDLPAGFKFKTWSKQSEVNDIRGMDIGIMPLPEDAWSMGKCGLKALQYMALGIPAVITPVGVNRQIIQHGENGFLCDSSEEWLSALRLLIENETLRKRAGDAGRKTVLGHYSVSANTGNFLSLFHT